MFCVGQGGALSPVAHSAPVDEPLRTPLPPGQGAFLTVGQGAPPAPPGPRLPPTRPSASGPGPWPAPPPEELARRPHPRGWGLKGAATPVRLGTRSGATARPEGKVCRDLGLEPQPGTCCSAPPAGETEAAGASRGWARQGQQEAGVALLWGLDFLSGKTEAGAREPPRPPVCSQRTGSEGAAPLPGPGSPTARASERHSCPPTVGRALGPALYLPVPPGGPQDGASAAGEQVGQCEHRAQPFPAQLLAGPAVQPAPWARALECPGAMVPGREGAPVGGATVGPCLGPGSPSEQGGVTYTLAPESHPGPRPTPGPQHLLTLAPGLPGGRGPGLRGVEEEGRLPAVHCGLCDRRPCSLSSPGGHPPSSPCEVRAGRGGGRARNTMVL